MADHSMISTTVDQDHPPLSFSSTLTITDVDSETSSVMVDQGHPSLLPASALMDLDQSAVEDHDKHLKHSCDHRVTAGGLCFVCGCQLSSNSSTMTNYVVDDYDDNEMISLKYVSDDFSVTKKKFFLFRCINYRTNLLENKKLTLILDLDNTLIHSIKYDDFLKEDHARDCKSLLEKDIITLNNKNKILTKIRPFVSFFLQEVSKLYELYIYTLGSRSYAEDIADYFDPYETLFDWRVISRDDCTTKGEKNLDVVLGGEEKAVVIVDDKESVWPKHKDNVLQIKPYYYWKNDPEKTDSTENSNNYINGEDVELLIMLATLTKLHAIFFHCERSYILENDVRQCIEWARNYYLQPNHNITVNINSEIFKF